MNQSLLTIITILITLIIGFYKKNKEKNVKEKNIPKRKKTFKKEETIKQNFDNKNFVKEKSTLKKQQKRKIIDREEEILDNEIKLFDENLVNDIIFAQILGKPKSKK